MIHTNQTVKCLPTMWETQVQSLGREDLLEKEMATHSSVLAWKIPWTEDPGYSLQATIHGVAKSRTLLSDFKSHFQTNANPLSSFLSSPYFSISSLSIS